MRYKTLSAPALSSERGEGLQSARRQGQQVHEGGQGGAEEAGVGCGEVSVGHPSGLVSGKPAGGAARSARGRGGRVLRRRAVGWLVGARAAPARRGGHERERAQQLPSQSDRTGQRARTPRVRRPAPTAPWSPAQASAAVCRGVRARALANQHAPPPIRAPPGPQRARWPRTVPTRRLRSACAAGCDARAVRALRRRGRSELGARTRCRAAPRSCRRAPPKLRSRAADERRERVRDRPPDDRPTTLSNVLEQQR